VKQEIKIRLSSGRFLVGLPNKTPPIFCECAQVFQPC